MTGALWLAAREIWERRVLFLVAAIAGACALGTPLLPGLDRSDIEGGVFGVLCLVTWGSALVLGMGAIGGELSARRMSFYFSRPLSGGAIWAGKVLGIAGLLLGAQILLLLPGFLTDRLVRERLAEPRHLLMIEGASILVLALALGFGVVVRTKSKALLADLLAAPIVVVVAAQALERVNWLGRLSVGKWIPTIEVMGIRLLGDKVVIALVAAAATLVATAVALRVGRTDGARVHRAFSLALWLPLGAVSLIAFVLPLWFIRGELRDVTQIEEAVASRSGRVLHVEGPLNGLRASFLYDTQTGRSIRTNGEFFVPSPSAIVTSPDDRWVALLHTTGRGWWDGHAVVSFVDLRDPGKTQSERIHLGIRGYDGEIRFSSDAAHLAVVIDGGITIVDVLSHRIARRIEVPAVGLMQSLVHSIRFVTPRELRFVRTLSNASDESKPTVRETWSADLGGRTNLMGRSEAVNDGLTYRRSPEGDWMLAWDENGGPAFFLDGQSRERLAELPAIGANSSVRFVDNDSVAIVDEAPSTPTVSLYAKSGRRLVSAVLPHRFFYLAGEVAPGKTLLADYRRREAAPYVKPRSRGVDLWVLDQESGALRTVASDLAPVRTLERWSALATGEAARLFHGPDGTIVRYDPLTGERRQILPLPR